MKKICVIILSLMLLVILAVPALAADVNLTASVSSTTVQTGDEVVITISSSGTTPFTSLGLFIEYDTSIFEFKSRSWGVAIIDASTKSFSETTGKVTAAWDEAGAYSGEIIKITLKVKGVKPANTIIKFGDLSCKNVNDSLSINGSSAQVALVCDHNYSDWTKVDDNKHQQVCSKCGDIKQDGHDWNDGDGQPSCDQVSTVNYTCLICHATKQETINPIGHKYDNDCDATCNNGCGTTREVSHNYVLVNTNSDAHWYECSICDDVKPGSWEKHTPGAEATTDSPQVCTVCDYVIKQAVGHQDVWEEDWTTDSEYHWHRCQTKKCYNITAKAKHDYDNDCDVDCNTCGYIRVAPHNYKPEWQANAQGHWNICAACNAKSEVLDHVPGPEATMDTPQTCEECNFIIKRELSHEHNFGDKWFSDDENHWQSCGECYEATEMEPHQWDEGVELDDGKMQYTCSICQKQVVTDGEQPSTVPSTQTPPTQKPAESKNSNAFPWQWAGIAAVILLIVGVVLLVIEFIRSRKTNMHGKYSK